MEYTDPYKVPPLSDTKFQCTTTKRQGYLCPEPLDVILNWNISSINDIVCSKSENRQNNDVSWCVPTLSQESTVSKP